MSKKVVTLGEIMLRLSTPDFKRFVQADTFDITYGGGEANVAVSLANYGIPASFVSRLPKNDIGEWAIQNLRKYNVQTVAYSKRTAQAVASRLVPAGIPITDMDGAIYAESCDRWLGAINSHRLQHGGQEELTQQTLYFR